ncbi:protocadherin-12 [Sphaerodactylus townsendi]|uniref:protocadherin-12 n=1 Tax=Sphaerodactylus townsendi TaxID=933632 RepID=UPI002025C1F7|nr:protocadherin-12 [Sphaerodactylus townsendi]
MFLVLYVPVLWWSFLLLVDCQEVTTFTVQYQVPEEAQPGTMLGRLSEELDWTENSWTVGSFQLLQPSTLLPIQMDSQEGLLRTIGRLDREQLCPHRDLCIISFNVLAAKYLALIHVDVHVLDINDNGPQFPQTALELEISESVLLQTRIPLDRAVDPDAGSNGLCSYLLSPSEHFALGVTFGSDGTQQVELVVVKEVDRERYSSFLLTVTAVDHGEPPRSGSVFVRVTVLDSNDNSPTFTQSSVTVEIREDALMGTLLVNLTATDPDQGPNGEIQYSFSKHTPVEVLRTFAIESRTGCVLLQQHLDLHRKKKSTLTELGCCTSPETHLEPNPIAHPAPKLLVRVLDVNDNRPDVRVVWAGQAAVVSEAQPKDSFVGLVMLSDPDTGDNGKADCYISLGAEHFSLRRINPSSYMLLTSTPLDREILAEQNLTLLVQDRGTPSLAVTRDFVVHVGDINDNVPFFETNLYQVSVAENSIPPSALLTVRAHDADVGLNGKVTYSIPDLVVLEWVTIDAGTGEIWARTAFDAEKMASFDFVVTAEDAGQPKLSSNVSVRVTVLDTNDNFPVIVEPPVEGGRASVTVLVDMGMGHVLWPEGEKDSGLAPSVSAPLLFKISATDADSGLNGALIYNLMSSNKAGSCILDPHSGEVYLNGSSVGGLVGHEWDLEVSVSDRGEKPHCARVLVKVTFASHCEDIPDSSPITQPLSPSVVIGICLVVFLAIFLVSFMLVVSRCRREKHGNMTYNCREAEHAYSQQPKKPPKPIQKSDIHVVPVLQRGDTEQPQSGFESPPEDARVNISEIPCHMTPTLYRTLRNQRNQSLLTEQDEGFVVPAVLKVSKPPHAHKLKTPSAAEANLCASCHEDFLPEATPQHHSSSCPEADREEACSRHRILRSLVRLSMAALAEQGPAGQLALESGPVQQISQLLSLLHQGQVQPKPNHKGNKYTAKHACCRNTSPHAEELIPKKGCGSKHHDFVLLGEELENLLDSPSGLDQLTEADHTWMARLSLPLSTDYKANVVSPGALPFLPSQEAMGRDEPHTFATFGKAAGDEPAPEQPPLANSFLSEMSTLLEIILSQKANSKADVSLGLWQKLSVCSRTLEVEGGGAEAATSKGVVCGSEV